MVEQSILTTIAYSDIFAFPLTQDELWRFLISKEKITKEAFQTSLQLLLTTRVLSEKDGNYCLRGREVIITDRQRHRGEVTKKRALAQRIIPQLAKIPTVLFIGISGGLAAGDAKKEDDIDLFLIVQKDTLFFSRFFVLALLQLLGKRRKRGQQHAANTFCVNFFIDETMLLWDEKERDIYTAREIAQVIPMFERGTTYTKFLTKNRWITEYLPNSLAEKRRPFLHNTSAKKTFAMGFLEKFLRFIQISYMKGSRTTEVITNHYLAFHPMDYRSKTLKELRLKMQSLGLLTKL